MQKYEFVAPCHFGMEAVLKRELTDLGYPISRVDDGRVTFSGDITAIARANIFLRTAERILFCVGRFKAETFDELFESVKKIPWEDYLPEDGKFWVKKASTAKSRLFSSSDIQSIVKKAGVERRRQTYHVSWFPEDGEAYPIRVFIYKDEVTIALDTSGESLHKRGYRRLTGKAPVSETLAAAILLLSPWNRDRILVDPFCGSGTFPIEAAMIGADMAPGMNREFTAEGWTNLLPRKVWYDQVNEAYDRIRKDVAMDIQGYDIDGDVIRSARENAREAGVDHLIHLQQRPVSELSHPKKYGFIITNPPYGERLEEREALPALYRQLGEGFARLDSWSCFVLTSYDEAEKYMGRKADKNRKIYNGMIRTYCYQFMGPRPPKKKKQEEGIEAD